MDASLTEYFFSGRPYRLILERLHADYGIRKSMSWLKRNFRRLGLKKRVPDPPEDCIKRIIQVILSSPDSLRGYRAVWQILRTKYKVLVRRDTVMKLLKELDPDGVARRKKKRLKRRLYHCKGPNFIWHLDGNDKLAPFGLCIHGCIDGFSRKVLWLKLSSTNHNPAVIARYYLETIEKIQGCPKVIRADYGTENCTVAKVHIALRMNHDDPFAGCRSFIYGPSTANTRIESWWATLRRFKLDWWIDICKELQAEGNFNRCDDVHRYTLGYVFGTLLEKDLSSFVGEWNNHPIRKNLQTLSPHGVPNDIYDMPSLHGTTDQLQAIDTTIWAHSMLYESLAPPALCPERFKYVCEDVLHDTLHLSVDDITHANCRNIYLQLVHSVKVLVRNGLVWLPLI